MKALEKDRTRRYETANGLAMDIQRHLSNEPVVARPPSAAYRLQKAWRRNKLAFSAGMTVAAALLLTLAALAVSTIRISHEQGKTTRALLAEIQAKGELEQTLQRERVDSYFHRITLAHRELSMNNLSGALKFLEECPKDLRGWEWRYLNRFGLLGAVVLQDTDAVYSVAFHPAGRQIAAACKDGAVKLWDLPNRKVIQRFIGHTNYVFSVAFRPGGRYLASAGNDRTIEQYAN